MINERISYINLELSPNMRKRYSKVYGIHKYWARKPWYPISKCIQKYSNEGDTVLDMFVGSGVTALEAILLNRKFIGFDLNPISIFICKNTISRNINIEKFRIELEKIRIKLDSIYKELYSTDETCQLCGNKLIIQHINIGPKYKGKETGYFFCEQCGKSKSKKIRKLNSYDYIKLNKKYNIKKWIPENKFPKKFYKDRFSYKGIFKVSDMYTSRNLYFLSELFDFIKNSKFENKNLFLIAFSNTVLHVSKLKSENVRPLSVNNYWIPDDYFEENPWLRFLDRAKLIIKAKEILLERCNNSKLGDAEFYNKSCFNTELRDESVDYIITDPPYGDAIQYSELSFIWNSWLGYKYNVEEEVIINPTQGKKVEDFFVLLEKSISEASRVLKQDKNYTLCFHNKEFSIWKGVLDIFKKYDFVLKTIDIVDTKGNSYNSNWAKFSPKTDFYLTFRKSKFSYTHNKKFTLESLLLKILENNTTRQTTIIYDILATNLIQELFFNKYQIDISKLTIKKLSKLIGEIENGN